MAEDAGNNQEDDSGIAPSRASTPNITPAQARTLALRTADMVRGSIGRAYRQAPLVFSIEYEEETDTHYMITVRFQPEGEFEGAAGLEEFSVGKDGVVESRRILRRPIPDKAGLPIVPIVGGLAGAGVVAIVIAILFAVGAFGSGDGDQIPAVVATATPEPTPIPTVTPIPIVAEDPTAAPKPTPTPQPTPTVAPAPTTPPTTAPTPTPEPTSTLRSQRPRQRRQRPPCHRLRQPQPQPPRQYPCPRRHLYLPQPRSQPPRPHQPQYRLPHRWEGTC